MFTLDILQPGQLFKFLHKPKLAMLLGTQANISNSLEEEFSL